MITQHPAQVTQFMHAIQQLDFIVQQQRPHVHVFIPLIKFYSKQNEYELNK